MRLLLLLAVASPFFVSCNNSGTAKTFCDTACRNDSFIFRGDDQMKQMVYVSVKDCVVDTIGWTHVNKAITAKIALNANNPVRINKSAINTTIKDTTAAWVTFNDCRTAASYIEKLIVQ